MYHKVDIFLGGFRITVLTSARESDNFVFMYKSVRKAWIESLEGMWEGVSLLIIQSQLCQRHHCFFFFF